VRLLLDTHALIWWLVDSRRLGPLARRVIVDRDSEVWVSAATAWEISIKTALGRLDLGEPPEECLPRELARCGFRTLGVSFEHALAVLSLPPHHDDPFDRMLVVQAKSEGLTILTVDPRIAAYEVLTMDASR
jgi:PIN domain nuclease of toxin-antitoxin system